MKKMNNKGYMLIEIVIASAIALVMAYFLIEITIKLVNKNNDYYIDSILVADKSIITKEIMDDINSKKLTKVEVNEEHTEASLTFKNETGEETKNLIINNENKTIKYGEYIKELSNVLNVDTITLTNDNNILTLTIPAYTNYNKEDYGIKITVPYSEDIEIIYPDFPDILIKDITLDGSKTNEIPIGNYEINPNCNNANVTFDYENWNLNINNINTKRTAVCNLVVTTKSNVYLNNYIKSLTESTQGNGKVVNEYGYRYEGNNPNNYIRFNDELWRIIGVFDTEVEVPDGTMKTETLTKIIRNDSIGQYHWGDSYFHVDNTGIYNDWIMSDLNKILNNNYYNSNNYYTSCRRNLYTSTDCDYNGTGINDKYRKMIKKVKWYLGGRPNTQYSAKEFYDAERSNGGSYFTNTSYKTINAYVGLIYASDYGFSALGCDREIDLDNDFVTANCHNNSWFLKDTNSWTMTQQVNGLIMALTTEGEIDANYGYGTGLDVKPVVYLDQTVYLLKGTGTIKEPYIIQMN